MKCEIIPYNQDVAVQNHQNASLLQDSRYCAALAKNTAFQTVTCRVLMDGQEAGLARFMEVRALGGLIHGITLDRGPLWNQGYGGAHHIRAFFDAFNARYPKRMGRKRRIIPEIEDGAAARKMLESAGLERTGEGYQTYLIDLMQDEERLRAGLAQKWRNVLNRAERENSFSLQWDDEAKQIPWFLKLYEQDKRRKNYDGPPPDLLRQLALFMSPARDMIIGRAVSDDGSAIAAVLIARHGTQATYLAGWSGEEGRAAGAHHRLLWQACLYLKNKDVIIFDLGGFHEDKAKGVSDFKAGMGGRVYRLAGTYR